MRAPYVVGNRWHERDGVHPDPLPRVSVIVAHYDQPDELARTLHALGASMQAGGAKLDMPAGMAQLERALAQPL